MAGDLREDPQAGERTKDAIERSRIDAEPVG
jgi:hypothetical protein